MQFPFKSQIIIGLGVVALAVAGCSSPPADNGAASTPPPSTTGAPATTGAAPASTTGAPATTTGEAAAADNPVKNVVVTDNKTEKTPKDTFKPEDKDVYATFDLDNPKDATALRGLIFSDDSALGKNKQLAETSLKLTTQMTDGDFHFTSPPKGWPEGTYHIEIWNGQNKLDSAPFKVAKG